MIVWNAATGEVRWHHVGRGPAFLAAAFAPDGRIVAAGGTDRQLTFFEASTGQIALSLRLPGAGDVDAVAFSPDGGTLACVQPGSVYLLDQQTGTVRRRFDSGDDLHALAFAPDGSWLAFGGDGGIEVWAVGRPGKRKTLTDRHGMVNVLAFSPDGSLLASGGHGKKKQGELLIWETTGWTVQHRIACHRPSVDTLAFSPDGSRLATGGEEKSLILWELSTLKKLATLTEHVASKLGKLGLAFAPGGRLLACADAAGANEVGRVTIYDLETLPARAPVSASMSSTMSRTGKG